MQWFYLVIAGILEIGWAVGLKVSDGWTRFWPSVVTLILIVFSYIFLSLALKTLPLGTAYAIWTGIGAAGTAVAGILLFRESGEWSRLFFIGVILAGIIGLKWVEREPGKEARTPQVRVDTAGSGLRR